MRFFTLLVFTLLVSASAFAEQCEKFQLKSAEETSLGKFAPAGRGTSGDLADGYKFYITDGPGFMSLQIISPQGQITQSNGTVYSDPALGVSVPLSVLTQDRDGNGFSITCKK